MLPAFITFTGVDENTSVEGMLSLASNYPVEFGFLLSPTREGSGRFPRRSFIRQVLALRSTRFRLAAHLIDGYSENLIEHQVTGLEVSGDLRGFERVQINSDNPKLSPANIKEWASKVGDIVPIAQCKGEFPRDTSVQWLFDPSKGTGTRPDSWPAAPGPYLVGYAGGINPQNVAEVVGQLGKVALEYWIDMASGVRTDQAFDLEKCRLVCEAVYG